MKLTLPLGLLQLVMLSACMSTASVAQKTPVCPEPAEAAVREDMCPPLPLLAKDATREDRLKHQLVVIELYSQCAGSKK
jgi:hypothetical protein